MKTLIADKTADSEWPADQSKQPLSLIVNGQPVSLRCDSRTRLLDVLRDHLSLTGAKEGCGAGECGACAVLIDGELAASCLVLAHSAAGKKVLTVEGLSASANQVKTDAGVVGAPATGAAPATGGMNGPLHPIQQAFIDEGAIQCGFCTPGLVLAAKALLDRHPRPSREEIKFAISGNLCRCTGYEKIISAIKKAARAMYRHPSLMPFSAAKHPGLPPINRHRKNVAGTTKR